MHLNNSAQYNQKNNVQSVIQSFVNAPNMSQYALMGTSQNPVSTSQGGNIGGSNSQNNATPMGQQSQNQVFSISSDKKQKQKLREKSQSGKQGTHQHQKSMGEAFTMK